MKTVAIITANAWSLRNFRSGLIRALLKEGYHVVLLAAADGHEAELRELGANFIGLKHLRRGGTNAVLDLRLLNELRKNLKEQQVDVALTFGIKPVIYGALAGRLAGCRNVATLTGLGYAFINPGPVARVASLLYRLALRYVDHALFHNPDDRQLFLDKGLISAERSGVVPGSGVPITDFPQRSYDEAELGRFLFVGRLLVDKGIREFFAAARYAKQINPGLSFHVVGDLDPENPASISAAELAAERAAGVTTFHGHVDNVREHLARASVVVLPSYREGCPRSLLEAAATGRALIGTDAPGVREVVLPERTGWLVPVGEGPALGRAIVAAASNPQLLTKYGAAARQLVEEAFTLEAVNSNYLEIIESKFW